jgi:hypothetical protein
VSADQQRAGINAVVRIAKWAPGKDPAVDPPDEVVEHVSEIADPAAIAWLQEHLAAQAALVESKE